MARVTQTSFLSRRETQRARMRGKRPKTASLISAARSRSAVSMEAPTLRLRIWTQLYPRCRTVCCSNEFERALVEGRCLPLAQMIEDRLKERWYLSTQSGVSQCFRIGHRCVELQPARALCFRFGER